MKSIIFFVIVALLSVTRADETTVQAVTENDITTEKELVTEKESVATLVTEEPAITTVVISTTIPTTIAAPSPTPTTTERIVATTTERIETTTAARTTTPIRRKTSTLPTTSVPATIRSRSRLGKARQNDEPKSDVLSIKLLKTDNVDTSSRSRGRPAVTAEPRLIPINVIRSDPTLSSRSRIQSVTAAPTSATSDDKTVLVKEDKSGRRSKVRYLSGKELGRDAPAVNYESKYEADKYRFKYETKDGQTRAENGVFENMGTEEQNYIVKGSYSYFDKGIEYIVNYTADNRGFKPIITVNNPNRNVI